MSLAVNDCGVREIAWEASDERVSVDNEDAFVFGHCACEPYQKGPPCPLRIYRKFLEIILRILHMTGVSPEP